MNPLVLACESSKQTNSLRKLETSSLKPVLSPALASECMSSTVLMLRTHSYLGQAN